MLKDLLDLLGKTTIHDLAQPYRIGIPHHPAHPPFLFSMSKAHGEHMRPGGVGSAAEVFTFGGHVGTHIDALCHFSKEGKIHGGVEVGSLQSCAGGIGHSSVDTITPIVRRGVLLDIARHERMDVLPADFVIGANVLEAAAKGQNVEVRNGDVVLIRTGWARYWDDPAQYINQVRSPGPGLDTAQWLSSRGIFAGGSDTIAFEFVPSDTMPVHVHFLVEKGIHIIEALNLEGLSEQRISEFIFIAIPLKIEGATGSPIRPVGLT